MKKHEKFFIACALGFENELLNEVSEVFPFLIDVDGRPQSEGFEIVDKEPGGIEIRSTFAVASQLNFFLKTANRILWRLETRKIKDLPDLKKFIKNLDFEKVTSEKKFQLEVSCQKSKINNEKKVKEVFSEVHSISQDENSTAVYIRFFQDLCTVSLDTSGRHLHFRTDNKQVGRAPLRETIAAFCLRQMLHKIPPAEWCKITWVDPVAGSGTFLQEAGGLFSPNQSRRFSFQNWNVTAKLFKSDKLFSNYRIQHSPFQAYYGFDVDAEMVAVAKRNSFDVAKKFHWQQADLFSQDGSVVAGENIFLIMNPPYGDRIKSEKSGIDFVTQAIKKFKPKKLGVLLPVAQAKEVKKSFSNCHSVAISHGGLQTEFVVLNLA